MKVQTFYRIGFWLPLVVPALVSALSRALQFGFDAGPLQTISGILTLWLFYGGVPYAVLALWATWWVGGRPEPEIRRMLYRAPLWMVAASLPVAALAAISLGRPMIFLAGAVLGAIVIIPLGYGYVGLVMLLREQFGPPPNIDAVR